jgi:hypothetical protein
VKRLEVKARTVLTGRTNPIPEFTGDQAVMCAVDGCLTKESMRCEVKVTNNQLIPAGETHLVSLCDIHYRAFDTLKWKWRRASDAASSPGCS